jgi:DNA modification methylase
MSANQERSYKLFCCDSRQQLKNFSDKYFDCILTDPPYALGFDYGATYKDTPENLQDLIVQCLPEMRRISKRVAILSGITPMWNYPKPDWTLCICWNTTGSHGYYGYTQWLPVLMYGQDLKGIGKINNVLKSDMHFINGGGSVGFQRTILEKEHCCPKPLGVIEWLIKRLTLKGDLVLDPFGGSGTTMEACQRLDRSCWTIEINKDFTDIIKKRCWGIKTINGSVDYEFSVNPSTPFILSDVKKE